MLISRPNGAPVIMQTATNVSPFSLQTLPLAHYLYKSWIGTKALRIGHVVLDSAYLPVYAWDFKFVCDGACFLQFYCGIHISAWSYNPTVSAWEPVLESWDLIVKLDANKSAQVPHPSYRPFILAFFGQVAAPHQNSDFLCAMETILC